MASPTNSGAPGAAPPDLAAQALMAQAEWDFKAADVLRASGFHEWSCYACQQAAEKAIKSARTLLATHVDTIKVHVLANLIGHLPLLSSTGWDPQFLAGLETLTGHNEGARYPGLRGNQPQKPPHDVYTAAQSDEAIATAQRMIEYCKKLCDDLTEFWSKNSHAP
jgi:HEPN domain-containing protein